MRVVFWQRVASPHQAAMVRALAARLGPDGVTCLFRSGLYPDLRQQGWQEPDYGSARVIVGLTPAVVDRAIADAGSEAVHIFSSLSHDPILRGAYFAAAVNGNVLGLLSEARDWNGWKGVARRLDSLRHERRWRSGLSFVLAMGNVGRRWFQSCGYDGGKVFDFCYVVEHDDPDPVQRPVGTPFRIVCVGQLIRRKRIDLLLRALSAVAGRDWSLEILGSGVLRGSLQRLAADLGLDDRVRFRGAVPNREVRARLAAADLLVLPSDWDGWGAVINEALSVGTRVVCSDHCGASDLLRDARHGWVFRRGSRSDLARALGTALSQGPLDEATRRTIRDYSESFSGPSVAAYLQQVIAWTDGGTKVRPEAPWRGAARPQA